MAPISLTPGSLSRLPARIGRRLSADRSRRRLAREFAALMDTRPSLGRRASAGPKIAVATFGSGCWHLVLEALLAHALSMRGASLELLLCDLPALPVCDERTNLLRDPRRCPGCVEEKRGLLDSSRIPWRGISAFVRPHAIDDADALVRTLADAEVATYVHGRWPLGQWTYVSACHFLRADARGSEPGTIAVRRRFLTTAIVVAAAVQAWLDDVNPDVVIAESGAHFMWRIVFELARARGIRVVCREIGKGGWDSHIYSLNAECMFPNWTGVWTEARNTLLPAEEADRVDAYVTELPAKTYTAGIEPPPHFEDADAVRRELGWPPDRKVVVLFTNVVWELATAGRDVGFDGMFDWIFETLRIASETPDVQFVIRVHPAENSVLTRERVLERIRQSAVILPRNVTCIGPENAVSVRSLCQVADLVTAYCSTAGIEAAIYQKPVMLCGAPHYRARGFTIDIHSRAEYAEKLRCWACGTLDHAPNDASETAKRYAHLFFLRYHIQMGWTTSPLQAPYRLKITNLSELLPGRSRAVDVVCDGILEGREILLPPGNF